MASKTRAKTKKDSRCRDTRTTRASIYLDHGSILEIAEKQYMLCTGRSKVPFGVERVHERELAGLLIRAKAAGLTVFKVIPHRGEPYTLNIDMVLGASKTRSAKDLKNTLKSVYETDGPVAAKNLAYNQLFHLHTKKRRNFIYAGCALKNLRRVLW